MRPARRKAPTPTFELPSYLPYYLAHILHRYDGNMAAELHRYGLNNSAWRVLSTLQFRDGLTIKELARYTVLERSFVGRIVGSLAERGHVSRKVPRDDRRNVRVWLAASGASVLQDVMFPIIDDQIALAFDGIADADRVHLLETLSRIVDNVYRAAREAPPEL